MSACDVRCEEDGVGYRLEMGPEAVIPAAGSGVCVISNLFCTISAVSLNLFCHPQGPQSTGRGQ